MTPTRPSLGMVLCACLLFSVPRHHSLNDSDLQLLRYYITKLLPVLNKTELITTTSMATFFHILFSSWAGDDTILSPGIVFLSP